MTTIGIAAAFLGLAACSADARLEPVAGGATADCGTRAYADTIGGPISLIDETGTPVTEADYKGRPSLVYFGFTYCPDVCPAALLRIDRALDQLPEGTPAPRTLLISVDPERDTPEQLAQYTSTAAFPEDTTGLTGSPEAIKAAAAEFVADFQRVDQPGSVAGYLMDHTSIIYLMDEEWRLKTFFTDSDTPESMGACLAELL